MQIRVFNYNTLERAHAFEAHTDYIRSIAVHPTQPYILTSSGMYVVSYALAKNMVLGMETFERSPLTSTQNQLNNFACPSG